MMDKDKAALAIVLRKANPMDKAEEKESEMPTDEELGQELFDSMRAKDFAGVTKAIRAIMMCGDEGEEGYADEEEDPFK